MDRDFDREAYVPWKPFAVAGAVFTLVVAYFFTLALDRPVIDFVGFGFILLLINPIGFFILGWLLSVIPFTGWRRVVALGVVYAWGTAWLVWLISIAYQFHQREQYCVPLALGGGRVPASWQYLPPFATCAPDRLPLWASTLAMLVLGVPVWVLAGRLLPRVRHGGAVRTG